MYENLLNLFKIQFSYLTEACYSCTIETPIRHEAHYSWDRRVEILIGLLDFLEIFLIFGLCHFFT